MENCSEIMEKSKKGTAPWIQCTFVKTIPSTCFTDPFLHTFAHSARRGSETRQRFSRRYTIRWSLHHTWLIKYWSLQRPWSNRSPPITFEFTKSLIIFIRFSKSSFYMLVRNRNLVLHICKSNRDDCLANGLWENKTNTLSNAVPGLLKTSST